MVKICICCTLNEKPLQIKKNAKEGFMYEIKIPNVTGVKEARFNRDCKKNF